MISSKAKQIINIVRSRPIPIIGGLIVVFVSVIFIISNIQSDKETLTVATVPKQVSIFVVGESPYYKTIAEVIESGSMTIFAQTQGVVSSVYFSEGDYIKRGERVLSIADNYGGFSSSNIQAQIASKQYLSAKENILVQKEIIASQKDVANSSFDNTENIRRVNKDSVVATKSLVDLNNEILTNLDEILKDFEDTNSGGSNDVAILSTKQAVSVASAGQLQIESQLNQSKLSSDGEPIAKLNELQKDITLKQLDLQEKTLDLNLEISKLQVNLSGIATSIMNPISPLEGTIERIFVIKNTPVSPRMPLAIISGGEGSKFIVKVPKSIMKFVSNSLPSIISLGSAEIDSYPSYLSTVPTEKTLYSINYNLSLPAEESIGNLVTISIPLELSGGNGILIPLEALHQTQTKDFVYLAEKGTAISRSVIAGNIVGGYVEILDGLASKDSIIISRNVINGDLITLK